MTTPGEAETFAEFIRAVGEAYGDRTAVVLDDDVLTYRQLEARSARMARGLLSRGVAKGTRIGLLFSNSPGWAVACAAVTRIGAVAVPLSTFSKPPELARVLRHADVAGVIAQQHFLGQDFVRHLGETAPELAGASGPELVLRGAPFLRWIVFTGDGQPVWARRAEWLTDEPADGRFDAGLLRAAEDEVHPEDIASMIYTSGQSAEPKGVLHSQGGIINKVHYLADMMRFDADTVKASTMPFFWVGGYALDLLAVLEKGGTCVCNDRATTMGTGGIIGAVGRVNPEVPGTNRRAGLGMSETFAMYSWGTELPMPEFPLCVPLSIFEPGYRVKLVDTGGAEVAEGERGAIVIRGPSVTKGLHKVRRSAAFDDDGYYRTGDEGQMIDGRIIFHGRLGDMIKTSGANVAPAEVERELMGLEGVVSAHVVAVPDPARGEVVGAGVVLAPGVELDADQIRTALRERLSTYKVPRLVAFFDAAELPLTPSRKVKKRELAALIQERTATPT